MIPMPKPRQKELRYYQREAVDSLFKYFESKGGNPLISMATGTGKAMTLCAFCKEAIERYTETNIVVSVSVKELVQQNYEEMLEIWPDAPATIYSAGVGVKDLSGQIIFGGIQSIYKQAYKINKPIHLLIIDEAQDLSENDGTMYRKFISDLMVMNPDLKVIGLSATIFRLKQGVLTDGKNALFTDVVYDYGMLQGITDGYLSPLISKGMSQRFDLTGVGVQNGDYIVSHLEKAVDKQEITKAIADEIIKYGEDRNCWLIFCVGVDHALHMRDEMRSRGITCEMVCGKTPKAERDDIFRRYKAGQIRCITNVNVMTKGTNIPQIDLIASCRPSKSAGLVVQAAGRGTRLSKDKENCLLLDFSNWLEEHGPIDLIRAKRKGEKGEGTAPVKTCPECKTIVSAGCLTCPECDFQFPPPEIKIGKGASDAAVLSTQLVTKTHDVTGVAYYRHKKEGKPDTLRVEYRCGLMTTFSKWVCLSHQGSAREMACFWWRTNAGTAPPKSTDEALLRTTEIKVPKRVHVKKIGKYHEIIGVDL